MPAPHHSITLADLYACVPAAGPTPSHEVIPIPALPEPAAALLAHDEHMTEVMERRHGCPVAVEVLARERFGTKYSRQILLHRTSDGVTVQGGIVRIHLDLLPPDLAAQILEEQIPLGRLLVDHQTLRRIDIRAYLRFPPTAELEKWLGPLHGQPTYGRLGYLHVDHEPVIEVFEILAYASLATP